MYTYMYIYINTYYLIIENPYSGRGFLIPRVVLQNEILVLLKSSTKWVQECTQNPGNKNLLDEKNGVQEFSR